MTKKYNALQILAAMGIALAIYLLYEQITLPSYTPCYINATVNCDAVIKGEVAKTLGIPTPIYGLIGYLVILYAAFKQLPKLLLGTSSFGLAFCAYIGFIELAILKTICPVCIICQLIMISVFILSLQIYKVGRKTNTP